MEATLEQQFFKLIEKSQAVLIVLPDQLTADAIGGGLAMRQFLLKLQKNVTLASSGSLPENTKFLPGTEAVQKQISGGKSLVVTLDTSVKRLEEISYETLEDKVQIFLKSQSEPFGQQDLSFEQEKFRFDLIIFLHTKSLQALGKFYEQSADLFYETPKINIDNQPDNEYYGTLNLVDVTATSVGEILAELLQKFEQQLLDEDMATCLLTGIISSTRSFQHVQTTPRAFLRASELVALGARQSQIVKHIYQTKSMALLRLWGRALARMKTEGSKIIYSLLTIDDFAKAEAKEEELLSVLNEFINNVSGYQVVGLVAQIETNNGKLLVAVHQQLPVADLAKSFGPETKVLDQSLGHHKVLELAMPADSVEALEKQFLEVLKAFTPLQTL